VVATPVRAEMDAAAKAVDDGNTLVDFSTVIPFYAGSRRKG
jgi:hypothetical protein